MAKRRKKTRTRRYSFAKKKSRRRGSSKSGDMMTVLGGVAYGAGRQFLSDKLKPVTTPLLGVAGSYADEVVLGTLSYFAMKGKLPFFGRSKLVRKIGQAGLIIESARVGSELGAAMLPASSTTVSTNGINATVF